MLSKLHKKTGIICTRYALSWSRIRCKSVLNELCARVSLGGMRKCMRSKQTDPRDTRQVRVASRNTPGLFLVIADR